MVTTATMTGAQFDDLPYEEGRHWELLEGDLVEVSSPTLDHQEIVYRILAALKQYLGGGRGIASHDVEFALSQTLACALMFGLSSERKPRGWIEAEYLFRAAPILPLR